MDPVSNSHPGNAWDPHASVPSDYDTASMAARQPGHDSFAPLPTSPVQGSVTRHHLPSRLTTPLPIANAPAQPVPIDNFAAPRSDSPIAILGSGGGSGGSGSTGRSPGGGGLPRSGPGIAAGLSHRARGSSLSDVVSWSMVEGHAGQPQGQIQASNGNYGGRGQDMYHQSQTSAETAAHGHPHDNFQRGGDTFDDRSTLADGESQRRFTLGDNFDDDDEHDEKAMKKRRKKSLAGGAVGLGHGQREAGKGSKVTTRVLWAIAVLCIIGIAVGVGIGVTIGKNHEKQEQQAQQDAASAASLSRSLANSASLGSLASATPATESASAASASLAAGTGRTSRRSSAAATASTQLVASGAPSATSLLTRPTPSPTRTTAGAGGASMYTTSYAFAVGTVTTRVQVAYSYPTNDADIETRAGGMVQFTQAVQLPDLRRGAQSGDVVTSSVRFRVPAQETVRASRLKERRAIDEPESKSDTGAAGRHVPVTSGERGRRVRERALRVSCWAVDALGLTGCAKSRSDVSVLQ